MLLIPLCSLANLHIMAELVNNQASLDEIMGHLKFLAWANEHYNGKKSELNLNIRGCYGWSSSSCSVIGVDVNSFANTT